MSTTNTTASEHPDGEQRLLISADALSHILGISTRTIWRRLSAGELISPVRMGKIVRWRLEEVKAWIEDGCPHPDEDSSKSSKGGA